MMLAINMIGVSEAFLLAEKLGLDWNKLHEICSTATSNSWALSNYCPAPGPAPAAPFRAADIRCQGRDLA